MRSDLHPSRSCATIHASTCRSLDFDGVIADTENHHIAAWQRTLVALGWQVPDEVAARSAEVDDREFLRELLAAQEIDDGDIDGWVRKKQVLTVRMLRDAPRVYPGVHELIQQPARPRPPGCRLGHLARERRGRSGGLGPAGSFRADRWQGRRCGRQA